MKVTLQALRIALKWDLVNPIRVVDYDEFTAGVLKVHSWTNSSGTWEFARNANSQPYPDLTPAPLRPFH